MTVQLPTICRKMVAKQVSHSKELLAVGYRQVLELKEVLGTAAQLLHIVIYLHCYCDFEQSWNIRVAVVHDVMLKTTCDL